MFFLLKKQTLYLRIFTNRVELKHLDTGQTINRSSHEKFSSERQVLANFEVALDFLQSLISEIYMGSFLKPSFKILIQVMEKTEGGLSLVEKRAFQDLAEMVNGKQIRFYEGKEMLSDEEVKRQFKKKKV